MIIIITIKWSHSTNFQGKVTSFLNYPCKSPRIMQAQRSFLQSPTHSDSPHCWAGHCFFTKAPAGVVGSREGAGGEASIAPLSQWKESTRKHRSLEEHQTGLPTQPCTVWLRTYVAHKDQLPGKSSWGVICMWIVRKAKGNIFRVNFMVILRQFLNTSKR